MVCGGKSRFEELKMCMNPQMVNVKTSLVTNELFGSLQDKSKFIMLPCGKCDDCRVSHSKEWALRALLELVSRTKKEQLKCWFLTLTYDNQNLPEDCKLNLEHISLFIKKIRHWFEKRKLNVKIKYFVCGEYGSKNYRPHYHMLIYGLPLSDLKVYKQVGQFDFLWTSQFLDKFWKRGFVVIGNLNYKTAYYTCRYTLKKYDNCDIKMSCSNGFAKKWCLEHINQLVASGYLRFGGRNYSIPKYFLKLIRKIYFGYGDKQEYFKIHTLQDAIFSQDKKRVKLFLASKIKFGDLEIERLKKNDRDCQIDWSELIEKESKNNLAGRRYAKWLLKRHNDRLKRLNEASKELNTDELFLEFDKKINRNRYLDLRNGEMKSCFESRTTTAIMNNKRIINQSLFALYHNRNNFV